MDTVLTGNIWKQVAHQAKAAKRRLAAVAYVSNVKYLKLRKDDVLICDASDDAIKARDMSARILQSLRRKGVEVRHWPNLHAKVAVFGRSALIGSCNLSASAADDLTEIALFTDRTQIVAQSMAFIHNLREHAELIGDDFLLRILRIKVQKARRRGRVRRGKAPKFGSNVWLVSVRQLRDDAFPKEQPIVDKAEKKAAALVAEKDSTISWIRWTGRSGFRSEAHPGDVVIQVWESLSGKRKTVFPAYPIVLRQDVDHWTRFYLSEPDNTRGISLKRFKEEAKKRGLTHLSKNSTRQLSPREAIVLEGVWP